jgi:acetolactate synthase-1/3 small subunit/acetolactate synthase II small subunit
VTDRLTIEFDPAEGAVLRVLGLIERRGYLLRSVMMNEQLEGASLTVDVEPRDAGRRVQVVAEQLRRLVDVNSVRLANPAEGPRV